MVKTKGRGSVSSILGKVLLSSQARKLLIYYVIYCIFFLLFYLALVSTISFFHFLLDHEMGVIENWLNRNTWEVLILSKFTSGYLTIKSLYLNNYQFWDIKLFLKKTIHLPDQKLVIIVLFIVIFLYALLNQFGSEFISRENEFTFPLTSYLGSILFYMVDICVLSYSLVHMEVTKKQKLKLNIVIPIIFYITTKIALPYVDKYTIFIFLHCISLNILILKNDKNFSNSIFYALFVIGPLATLLGIDLVWDNSYALYSYPQTMPILGVLLIWLTALVYYLRKA
jgi:hypothetical protein